MHRPHPIDEPCETCKADEGGNEHFYCSVCSKPITAGAGTCLCLPSHGLYHPECDPHPPKPFCPDADRSCRTCADMKAFRGEDEEHKGKMYECKSEDIADATQGDSLDSMVRDFTQMTPRTKSEVRARITVFVQARTNEHADHIKFITQTAHRAYHEGSLEDCPKDICSSTRKFLKEV